MRDLDELFTALGRSKFRARFALSRADRAYIARRSADTIRAQARTIVSQRLSPASPPNDGKQTPVRGHPVFVAQHATATCCRKCLARWHRIVPGRALSDECLDYILQVIERWLSTQMLQLPADLPRQLELFPSDECAVTVGGAEHVGRMMKNE